MPYVITVRRKDCCLSGSCFRHPIIGEYGVLPGSMPFDSRGRKVRASEPRVVVYYPPLADNSHSERGILSV